MKKDIFKKGMAFLACFALVLTTMVSSLSMMVNASEREPNVTINVETENCRLYYRLSWKGAEPKSDEWNQAIGSVSFNTADWNKFEIKVMPNQGYQVSSYKLGEDWVALGGGGKVDYVEEPVCSSWGGGEYVDRVLTPGIYTLKLAAEESGGEDDPPTGGENVSITEGERLIAGLTVTDHDESHVRIDYQCEFGSAVSKVTVNGAEFTGEAIVDLHNEDRFYVIANKAESYTISFAEGVSDNVSIVWSYDRASAISKYGNDDAYVEHGKVELVAIRRDRSIFFDDKHPNESIKNAIRSDGGDIFLKRGDDVTLRLIPDYGYQLKSASLNGEKLEAQEEVSTFEIRNIQGNLHFAGAFVKAEDKTFVASDLVSKASIANGANAVNTGNLSLEVNDNASYNKDLTPVIGDSEVVSALELNLNNIVSKGDDKYWKSNITEFTNPIKLSLTLDQELAAGEKITVVRDHNGTLTELPATYVNGVLSFESNQFSTYTVVKTKAETVAFADMDSNVKVSAGKGTIAKITDAKVQQACETRSAEVDVLASQIETKSKVAEVVKTFAFDVQGIASGEVTLNIGTENAGKLVLASHFGGEAWDNLGLCEVNEKGDVTVKSDSYSPIMLSVLNITADDLTDEAKTDVKTVNYDPQQSVKAPKTGDNSNLLVYVVVMVIALALTAGLVVIKKRRNI